MQRAASSSAFRVADTHCSNCAGQIPATEKLPQETMTKSELIDRIARRNPEIDPRDAKYAVRLILSAMAQRLRDRRQIKIHNFGSFGLKLRPSRVARNPRSGGAVHLPERYVPRFKISKGLRERVHASGAGGAPE
jgi:integration host factor subunit beta